MTTQQIIYTEVDEAPALATWSLLPILEKFAQGTGVVFTGKDISLAGRIIVAFPDNLSDARKIPEDLGELAKMVKLPETNIIKLPNISASIPQLREAIRELQQKGYDIPDYPEQVTTEEDKEVRARYAAVLGSAVNPVLREGNSDRRAASSVKAFGRKNPHRLMKAWPDGSRTRVAHMTAGDFYGSETSITVANACEVTIEFVGDNGGRQTLKERFPLLPGEVIDAAVMNVRALRVFYAEQIKTAAQEGILLSLHLKATMMKVSDPVLFGHCVSVFYQDVFAKYGDLLQKLGVNPNNGLADLYARIETLPVEQRTAIEEAINACYEKNGRLAMVDSSRGITNLHLPNNVIVDASMPVVIRDGGRMWGPDGQLHDTIAMVPDRAYATIYQQVVEDCKKHGAFDPATMGSVANVGLMAQKAEEYGSHDKTFVASANGVVRLLDGSGTLLLEQRVETGDIFRSCQTKDAPIRDWVALAISRARIAGTPAVFWLDDDRAHDVQLLKKVKQFLSEHDIAGLDIRIMSPNAAMAFSLERIRKGLDTIAVTGNVLRDYLTDLFPILELGTSAKMLSIVPLMNGGGLFETGAGGSAPKHVQQFLAEGHLRWDSLGEFCALVPSFEHIAATFKNPKATVLAQTLDRAIGLFLENGRSPSRKAGELDTRGSHFYLALYWAKSLADQDDDAELKARFAKVFEQLAAQEEKIVHELSACQGQAMDIGGYYRPDPAKVTRAMRPSATLNAIIDAL